MSTIAKPLATPINENVSSTEPHESKSTDEGLSKAQLLTQTIERREEATKLLDSLLDAKSVSERNLASINQDDLLKRVTGNSSMDNAIASTRRLIDSFNRVIDDLRRNLSDEDVTTLG